MMKCFHCCLPDNELKGGGMIYSKQIYSLANLIFLSMRMRENVDYIASIRIKTQF